MEAQRIMLQNPALFPSAALRAHGVRRADARGVERAQPGVVVMQRQGPHELRPGGGKRHESGRTAAGLLLGRTLWHHSGIRLRLVLRLVPRWDSWALVRRWFPRRRSTASWQYGSSATAFWYLETPAL